MAARIGCNDVARKSASTPKKAAGEKAAAKPRATKAKAPSAAKSSTSSSATRRSGGSGKDLVIVESPKKARSIAKFLGSNYIVKASMGHVRDLPEKGQKGGLGIDVENNYEPNYQILVRKKDTVADLRKDADKAGIVYLATDPDREGEAIAWHLQKALNLDDDRVRRVAFHEITEKAVKESFSHAGPIDMDRVNAQQARRFLDRFVGYQLSPLLWKKVARNLSAGRVQSVATRLIVDREREIRAFVQEEFWRITAVVSPVGSTEEGERFEAGLSEYAGKKFEASNEADAQKVRDDLATHPYVVSKVEEAEKLDRADPPFKTSTLQQQAAIRLRFSGKKTMKLAQELYEGIDVDGTGPTGLITYMRTDSVTVAAEAQQQARAFIADAYGDEYLPDEPPVYKTKSKTAQEAHEAVRPTDVARTPAKMKPFLGRDQFRMYKLVWDRFVASQMAPAIYDTVSVDIHAGRLETPALERPYLFRATGSSLRFRGFLAVYQSKEEEDAAENQPGGEHVVPTDLTEGEALDLLRLLPEQHFTQPPPRFSEASLVKELEENGIGRPSTYAMIVSTIQQRGYVEQEQKRLYPTEIGAIVNDLLVEHFPDVVSVDFTANLEDDLDEIADGKAWVPVIDEFYQQFSKELTAADKVIPKMDLKKEAEPVGRDCPLSGHPLVYRDGRFGRFIGCSDYPRCKYTEQVLVKVGVTCPQCGGDLIEKRTRKGRVFYGCATYPECDWTNWKRPVPQPCPVCNGVMVQENKSTLKCTSCGHTMDAEVEEEVKETV
jgi:DNA topoisomerase-1